MSKSILERSLEGAGPPQPAGRQDHSDLLYNLNYWRNAWSPYLSDATSRPFDSLSSACGSEYKVVFSIGILIYMLDAGSPYTTSIKTGLGLTDEEFLQLSRSLTLVRLKMKGTPKPAVKSLTRNLNDRVRQIGR